MGIANYVQHRFQCNDGLIHLRVVLFTSEGTSSSWDLGPYSLNLLYSKEPVKSKDFLYFLPLPLNFPQTKEPDFLSLTFKETLKI